MSPELQQKLKDFGDYLLECEMRMAQELGKNDRFFDGAFTWISAIRYEFKDQFRSLIEDKKSK